MNLRDRPHLLFACLAAAVFAVADIGFAIFARLTVGQSSFGAAVSETLHYFATQPIGTLMLFAPFALLGWMTAALAARKAVGLALLWFTVGATILGWMYFGGFIDAEQALQDEKWTASALSVGLLPFRSIPVLVVIWFACMLSGRSSDEI
jgi:hypothetical protein